MTACLTCQQVTGRWASENRRDLFTYKMLLQRELEQDAMLWQTPTLALTAQEFLLRAALNPTSSPLATFLSAGLALVVALMSLQLVAKHCFLNLLDPAHMHALEAPTRDGACSSRQYYYTDGSYRIPDWLAKHESPPAWPGEVPKLPACGLWEPRSSLSSTLELQPSERLIAPVAAKG